MATITSNPLFEGQSSEKPSLLTISFAADPTASLGAQLSSHDNALTNEMFLPGYASIGGLVDGFTLARKSGVEMGDCLVAVNAEGFRRFPPDFENSDLTDITRGLDLLTTNDGDNDTEEEKELKKQLKGKVITGKGGGESYQLLLSRIKEIKSSTEPLVLSLERYTWDSRVHSWSRFLSARNGNVPQSMTMIQAHERWRQDFFPINLTEPSLQSVFKAHAVSEVDVGNVNIPAAVYVNYAKLQGLARVGSGASRSSPTAMDVVKAFVVYTEVLLSRSSDPRRPKTCQFIDLTGVSMKQGLRVDVLKKIYATFEANYPETLEKMVMFPVSKMAASTAGVMLSFVNENTRKKFRITDDLSVVCKELGWDQKEIENVGSVNAYMHKHLKNGTSFVVD